MFIILCWNLVSFKLIDYGIKRIVYKNCWDDLYSWKFFEIKELDKVLDILRYGYHVIDRWKDLKIF